MSKLDYKLVFLESNVELLLRQLLHIKLLFTFLLLALVLVGFSNFALHLIMDFNQGLIYCVLSKKLIFEFSSAHKKSFKNQVESLITSKLMKTCSQRPEESMAYHSSILEGSLEQEFTKRVLMMNLILESLDQLWDIETQIGVIQE